MKILIALTTLAIAHGHGSLFAQASRLLLQSSQPLVPDDTPGLLAAANNTGIAFQQAGRPTTYTAVYQNPGYTGNFANDTIRDITRGQRDPAYVASTLAAGISLGGDSARGVPVILAGSFALPLAGPTFLGYVERIIAGKGCAFVRPTLLEAQSIARNSAGDAAVNRFAQTLTQSQPVQDCFNNPAPSPGPVPTVSTLPILGTGRKLA